MFSDNLFSEPTKMDPIFFSPPNGLPSESKLATYMSHQNVTASAYGLTGLTTGLSKITLDSPISIKKAQVSQQSPEFIPSRLNTSPCFYSAYSSVIPSSGVGGANGNVTPVKANNITPILGGSPYTAVTPIKGRSLIREDSPHSRSIGDSPGHTSPQSSPPPSSANTSVTPAIHQENVGGTTYFYQTSNHNASASSSVNCDTSLGNHHNTSQTLPYSHPSHVYPGPASNVVNMLPRTQLSSAFFIPEEMRAELLAKNDISNQMDIRERENQDLPLEVDNYHSLYALEPMALKMTLPSCTYKAINSTNGVKYCLRRLHGFRLQSTKGLAIVDMWKKLRHSNVVQLREIFTTKGFNDQSLVLVYDYHAGSQTLFSKYFTPNSETNGYTDPFPGDARPFRYRHKSNLQRSANSSYLPETEIWSIIMQLTAGLRAIHQAGLACRSIDPSKIICTGKRVRFSFVGISDIVYCDPTQTNPMNIIDSYRQEDLTALGRLVLALACRSVHSVHEDNIQTSIGVVSRQYSADLRNLILYLLQTTNRRNVTDLMPMIGARFYSQLDALQSQCDMQEDELAKEMESGRLYRLLVKLGCINERPEYNMDICWSETGDRYMLQLFRDYLFHSVTEDGKPWLDHAHIVQCLNKLDAGTLEKIQLMSRDEESVLVVTYAELKHCLEKTFADLTASTQ